MRKVESIANSLKETPLLSVVTHFPIARLFGVQKEQKEQFLLLLLLLYFIKKKEEEEEKDRQNRETKATFLLAQKLPWKRTQHLALIFMPLQLSSAWRSSFFIFFFMALALGKVQELRVHCGESWSILVSVTFSKDVIQMTHDGRPGDRRAGLRDL